MNQTIARATATMTPYARLIRLLTYGGARYRLIDHPPEGRTHEASALRGNPDFKAAKCIVARVKLGKKAARYALVVIPGNRRADLGRLSELLGGMHAVLALRETAEALTGCVSGSIMPFSFHPDLHLIVDPELLKNDEVFFNAARLDRSVALATEDYVTLAHPHIETVADLSVLA